jgi:hypothetical protein
MANVVSVLKLSHYSTSSVDEECTCRLMLLSDEMLCGHDERLCGHDERLRGHDRCFVDMTRCYVDMYA